jgi:hypothetical protein
VSVLAAALLFTGCSTLLDDDFEDYPAGTTVGGAIPGSPTGDNIVAEGSGHLYQVSPTTPLSGRQSLELREAVDPCEPGESGICETPFKLVFDPATAKDNGRSILLVSWRGRLENPTDFTRIRFAIGIGHALRFDIRRDQVEIAPFGELDPPGDGVLERDFRTPHRFLVRLSPDDSDSSTFGVVVEGGGVDPESNEVYGTVSLHDAFAPNHLVLTMEDDPGPCPTSLPCGSFNARYRVDDVSISRGSL